MDKKRKLDCVTEFWKKWWAYQKAVEHWILDLDRLKLSSVSSYEWFSNDEVFHKFEKTLKKHKVTQPDLPKLHRQATKAAIPILEFLFGPNEIPVIPELPSWCSGSFKKWSKETDSLRLDIMNRIMGARNKILSAEFKTKAKIIPRSGWSNPYSITHWAKVFNINRKTMQGWLEYSQIIARKIGSKWQIANEDLPTTGDKNSPR